jgi:hypothetical protein
MTEKPAAPSRSVLGRTTRWLEARKLRNRLVHEYLTDPAGFAVDLQLAQEYSGMLLETYERFRRDVMHRLGLDIERVPPPSLHGGCSWSARHRMVRHELRRKDEPPASGVDATKVS